MQRGDQNATAAHLGLPSVWVLAVWVPALAVTLVTGQLVWGLVALLGTMVVVVAATAVRGTVAVGERSWFGVPALVVWVGVALVAAGGRPSDADLFTVQAVGPAALVLGAEVVLRGRRG